jgi:hypothetical protein
VLQVRLVALEAEFVKATRIRIKGSLMPLPLGIDEGSVLRLEVLYPTVSLWLDGKEWMRRPLDT